MTQAPQRYAYGPDPSQWAELYLPAQRSRQGVAVVIHGGFWRARYTAELGAPLARDLAAHGVPAWNLEYRRLGNGGGWPETFDDVAHGIDALRTAAADHALDLGHVVALGHSAGGQLAVWAAGRLTARAGSGRSPTAAGGGTEPVAVTGVVSQSGLLNLAEAQRLGLSDHAVTQLLGADVARTDPLAAVPLNVPVYAVHARDDDDVPAAQSRSYVDAVAAAGGTAAYVEVPGDHYALIDVGTEAWAVCRELVLAQLPRA